MTPAHGAGGQCSQVVEGIAVLVVSTPSALARNAADASLADFTS